MQGSRNFYKMDCYFLSYYPLDLTHILCVHLVNLFFFQYAMYLPELKSPGRQRKEGKPSRWHWIVWFCPPQRTHEAPVYHRNGNRVRHITSKWRQHLWETTDCCSETKSGGWSYPEALGSCVCTISHLNTRRHGDWRGLRKHRHAGGWNLIP